MAFLAAGESGEAVCSAERQDGEKRTVPCPLASK